MHSFEDINIVLASQSPRRRELLGLLTADFEIVPADIEEIVPEDVKIYEVAQVLATKKALHVAKLKPQSLVIGCDTVVLVDGEILGKPRNENEAFEMLTKLSGRAHTVISGVCLRLDGKSLSFSEQTEVEFYPLSADEISAYVLSGEPFDKAGGYGIQGLGALMVKRIDGDFYNVVGFPISRIKREIARFLELVKD